VDFSAGWITFEGIRMQLGTATDIGERKHAEEKLRLLASELSLTEERERRRMAVYLHDVIGQSLAMCKIKIRTLQRSFSVPDAEMALKEARELVEQSIRDTQSLTFELCPPILYELRFEAAVEWLADRMQQQHGIAFRCEDDRQPKPLGDDIRVILFQAIREIFVNVVKHARAKNVQVAFAKCHGTIRIDITDDGVGIETSRHGDRAAGGGGFGLFNIRERLTYLGGKLEIESHLSRGTHVTITAPLREDSGDQAKN
jgi:signal transduction histidine kinase